MKCFVKYDKKIQDFTLPEGKQTITELRKMACDFYKVKQEEIVMRSGTKPVKDDFKLQENKEIIMAKIKPVEPVKEAEEVYEYTYEYEEVYEESAYDPDANSEDDDDEPSDK